MTAGEPAPRTAVGFIRRAASGEHRRQDEDDIHHSAATLGYAVAAIVYDISRRGAVVNQLRAIVWGEDADAVLTPDERHLSTTDAEDLIAYADTIYVSSRKRFSRNDSGLSAGAVRIVDMLCCNDFPDHDA